MPDADAFAAFYREHYQGIYTYIYRRTSSTALAEDLAQETFCKAWSALQEGKGWTSHARGWLYRIAHNLVIDEYRRRGRITLCSIDDLWSMRDPDQDPLGSAERICDADALQAGLRHLTEEQQQVFHLRLVEGYSFGDIAATTDKTDGAVKALLHRARVSLRQQFHHFHTIQERTP